MVQTCLHLKIVLCAFCDMCLPHYFIVNIKVISIVPSLNILNVPVFSTGEHTLSYLLVTTASEADVIKVQIK